MVIRKHSKILLLALLIITTTFLYGQDTMGKVNKAQRFDKSNLSKSAYNDSTKYDNISFPQEYILFQKRQDSLLQTILQKLEIKYSENQNRYDTSLLKITKIMQSNLNRMEMSINEIKASIKNDSATTQKLTDAFLEKSKNDAIFFKQISASGKILSVEDSIFLVRLDSSVSVNLNETEHILKVLKGQSKFLDVYINLSLFSLGIIGGNLLNGQVGWALYASEVGGAALAWIAISGKHTVDDDINDIQQINDALGDLKKDIRNFRQKIASYNYKYPSFLSEKIPLVGKKYDLLSHSLNLENILDGTRLKHGSKRYALLMKSDSWLEMFIISGWHSFFPLRKKLKHRKYRQ